MGNFNNIVVIVGAIIFLLFGLFHLFFWRIFDWKNDLIKLSQINSNIIQMLNIGTSLLLLSFGFILIIYRIDILSTGLGKAILIVSSLFFLVRLILEFVFPGRSIIFGFILLLCSLIFLIPVFIK